MVIRGLLWPGDMVDVDVKKVARIPTAAVGVLTARAGAEAKAAALATKAGPRGGHAARHPAVDGLSVWRYLKPPATKG